MADEEVLRVLHEIRDLLREQVAAQQRAHARQDEVLENQRRALRRVRPLFAAGALVILGVLAFAVVLLIRLSARYW
jgi:hypothetical protein